MPAQTSSSRSRRDSVDSDASNVIETREHIAISKNRRLPVYVYSRFEGVFPVIIGIRRCQFFRRFAQSALSSVWIMAYV